MGSSNTGQETSAGAEYDWETSSFTIPKYHRGPRHPLDWARMEYKHFGNERSLFPLGVHPDYDFGPDIGRAREVQNMEYYTGENEDYQKYDKSVRRANMLMGAGDRVPYWAHHLSSQYDLPGNPFRMPEYYQPFGYSWAEGSGDGGGWDPEGPEGSLEGSIADAIGTGW